MSKITKTEVILQQQPDVWMIVLTCAMVLVGIAAFFIAVAQRNVSIRANRIALLTVLFEQLHKMRNNKKSEDVRRWEKAILNIIAEWAPTEAKKIQIELQKTTDDK